jgi:peptidoglycan/xylan/chitin deacetylase (PgdA/CDA1 family)
MSNAAIARMKQSAIAAGFAIFRGTGAHRLAARWTGGLGAIIMLHRVRPWTGGGFAPNRLLEITPEFLEEVILTVRGQGFDLVSMDPEEQTRRFAVLTFDDGYRDNLIHALPVLRRQEAPFTLYAVPGFADRTAGLWWVELEEAVRVLNQVEVAGNGGAIALDSSNDSEKVDSFNRLYWLLREMPEAKMRSIIRGLAENAGIDWCSVVADACMDWDELRQIAAEPLCTIGAHTLTHPMLAKADADAMRGEIAASRSRLEESLGRAVHHFAYPVGDAGSAGPREFAAVADMGFASAVTTRPGMVFAEHGAHLHALPRLSINGNWQDRSALEVLLSGAPFAVWNRGQRVNAA